MHFKSSIDVFSAYRINGWALLLDQPENKLSIQIMSDSKVIAQCTADCFREDLRLANFSSGFCAYFIEFDPPLSDTNIVVRAVDPKTGEYYFLNTNKNMETNKIGYQTFYDQAGDSDSHKKLNCLRIPNNLDGMSVLDIGCNEGYFCIEAVKRGASRVVGVDANGEIIKKAIKRCREVEYINSTWWDLTEEKFDLILFLSAVHYETDQFKLFSFLLSRLKQNGKLILECGVASGEGTHWNLIKRHDGAYRYPTKKLLIDCLLKDYVVTDMGRSVAQSGDPVSRFVFHCSKRKKMALFVAGKSGVGKTHFAYEFSSMKNATIFSLDSIFHSIKALRPEQIAGQSLVQKIYSDCDVYKIDKFVETLCDAGHAKEFVAFIYSYLPIECNFLIIEGYPLSLEEICAGLSEMLMHNGFVVWKAGRLEK